MNRIFTTILSMFLIIAGASQGFAITTDEFRALFSTNAGVLTPEEQARLIYTPVFDPHNLKGAENSFVELHTLFKSFSTEDLYLLAKQNPVATKKIDGKNALKATPMIIVIVPGLFSEFIKTHAFEELFSDDSPHRKTSTYVKNFEALGEHSQAESFDLSQGQAKKYTLNNLFKVSTINNTNINVILFETPLLSLESVGSSVKAAITFTQRFNQFCKIKGDARKWINFFDRGID